MSQREPAGKPRGRTFAQLSGLPLHPIGHPDHRGDRAEFVIPDTQRDLPCGIYLTMVLAKDHPEPVVVAIWQEVRHFFVDLETDLVRARGGDDLALKRARRRTRFPEVGEIGCGYTAENRAGKGIRDGILGDRVLDTLLQYPALSKACAEEPDAISLIELVGLDRVSDIVATIAKRHLIEYTQRMAARYKFPDSFQRDIVIQGIWDRGTASLKTGIFLLPVADDGRAILLLPKGIVRSAPPFTAAQYTRHHHGALHRPLTKREVLEDMGNDPERLLRAMRNIFQDEWRYRPRRDLRDV